MTIPSQIETRRDATEFLTGQWATGAKRYSEAYCDSLRTADLLDLARQWESEARQAADAKLAALPENLDLTVTSTARLAIRWDPIAECLGLSFAGARIAQLTAEPSLSDIDDFLSDMDAEADAQGIRKPRATEVRALISAMQSVDDWLATIPHDIATYGEIGVSF